VRLVSALKSPLRQRGSKNEDYFFWANEGPMLKVEPGNYKGYILHIEDLNPQQHTKWALSRKEMLRIGFGFIKNALFMRKGN
jgi:hypothetical protein